MGSKYVLALSCSKLVGYFSSFTHDLAKPTSSQIPLSTEGQQIIFQHWSETIFHALEIDTALISGQPILHTAIIVSAPLPITQDIISQFDCITTQDSRGRYPIDVAMTEGLSWGDDRMEDIIHVHTPALTTDQQGQACLTINVAALHGLKWENGTREVADKSMNEIGNSNYVDALTALFPFMLAAVGESFDLSSMYELMWQSPHDVKLINILM
jgi:hypothetical protein